MLDNAAFGAATEVTPKFISPADPAARWTGAHGGQAFFGYSTNYLIDLDNAIIVDRVASLADRLLEDGYAVGLDLFAFRLLGFALDPKFVFLNQVELLGLPIDGIHDRRRQVGC